MSQQVLATSTANRKAQLVQDGQAYRLGILHSRAVLSNSLLAKPLVQQAITQAISLAGLSNAGRLKTLLPFAISAISYLSRTRLLKPVIGVGIVVAIALHLLEKRKVP